MAAQEKDSLFTREYAQGPFSGPDSAETLNGVTLETLETPFSVCKVTDYTQVDLEKPFVFTGTTDTEKSLVCPAEIVPENTVAREDGWRAFRICGELDFSLIGILAGITKVLADEKISVFAISTFNTDYVLVKENDFGKAIAVLSDGMFRFEKRMMDAEVE